MKLYATLLFSVIIVAASAQVPKVPVYEVFTSSTCPPCRPANEHMTPIFDQYEGQIAVIKYQMSWPGNGDPYYTSEAGTRRQNYGVSSVPALFRAGNSQGPSSLATADIDADLAEMANMKAEARYMIDPTTQKVRVRAYFEAMKEFTGTAHKIYIAILEKETIQNKKSNGENEFHHVFKKMLPKPGGDIIVGDIANGFTKDYDETFEFMGSYRLPSSANDPIDHSSEHSVEEFDDLHVIMIVQNMTTNEVYQAAIGEATDNVSDLERAWGTPAMSVRNELEINTFKVFPNPASNRIQLNLLDAKNANIQLYSVTGAMVNTEVLRMENSALINTESVPSGLYLIEVENNNKVATQKVTILH